MLELTFSSDVLDVEHAARAESFELLGILSLDWSLVRVLESDVWHQSVEGGAYGRPLGVRLADALLTDEVHLDLLPWSKLGDEDVVV